MTKPSLGEFFGRNSHLFPVLGVFGAIAVYFTQLELGSRWRRLGIVSSLTIFILIAIVIQKNLPPESSDKAPFDFVINLERQKTGLVVFYVAFYVLVLSVTAIVLQFSNTLIFLFQFLFFISGIGIAKWIVSLGADSEEDNNLTLGEEEVASTIAKMLRNATFAFSVGGGVLTLLWLQGVIPVQQLVEFQIDAPLTAVVIGIFSGLLSGGGLWILLMVMMLSVHFMLRKLRDIGLYDEDWNLTKDAFQKGQEKKE